MTKRKASRGFTLVEIMIGATLGAFILLGVLSTFLFLGRSGANFQNYADMETQGRTALETFAEDVRQASAIHWVTNQQIQLTVNSATVTYTYDATAATFSRGTRRLISGITPSSFSFKAYKIDGTELALNSATALASADINTKQLQISLEARRTSRTVVAATNSVLSARFILRNKLVTA